MSYQSSADLAVDAVFQQRMTSCLIEQATTYKDDPKADFVQLSDTILRSPYGVLSQFCQQAATQPAFNEAQSEVDITDAQILSVVQALYPTIAALNYIKPAEPEKKAGT